MLSPLERLDAVCPHSAEDSIRSPSGCDFSGGELGVIVPPAHVELTNLYGAGVFDEFIILYVYGHPNENFDIGSRTRESRSSLSRKEIPQLRSVLAAYNKRPEDLIHWGSSYNGDSFFWIPDGEPNQWPTLLVAARQFDQEVLVGDSTSVLLSLLTGATRTHILPDDFPSEEPMFEPLS